MFGIHNRLNFEVEKNDYLLNVKEIYIRSILLFPLLINHKSGGISAALDSDENRIKSGGYGYCWTRDGIFITTALDLLNMKEETEKFYDVFCKNTQSENGMWEQRFYTDGRLAPCWGYQIDETASVIFGVYKHYEFSKNLDFLINNLKMCEKACSFLLEYSKNILNIEDEDIIIKNFKKRYKKPFDISNQVSYDLWEMNEGVHLYSLSCIIAAFDSMIKIYDVIEIKNDNAIRLKSEKRRAFIEKMNNYSELLKEYIRNNLIDSKQVILKRNLRDSYMDISVIGAVYPFRIFNANEKVVKNTVDKINMLLRTYKGGYLRFEGDNYMGGNNPWVINTLWMALYFLEINDIKAAEECFKYVVDTACDYGFLSEQVNNEDKNFKWIIGLGWSHAMFIIVLNELINKKYK